MKVRLTVTLEVNAVEWAHQYGIDVLRQSVRDDVVSSVQNAIYGFYGPDGLGLVTDVTVK